MTLPRTSRGINSCIHGINAASDSERKIENMSIAKNNNRKRLLNCLDKTELLEKLKKNISAKQSPNR